MLITGVWGFPMKAKRKPARSISHKSLTRGATLAPQLLPLRALINRLFAIARA